MKLSFSTLGCPDWSFDEVLSTAKDLGMDGVEIRGLEDKIYIPDFEGFSPNNIEQTKKKIKKIGLNIPILTSGAMLADKLCAMDSFVEACAYVNLAARLGVKYIRVMGTGEPQDTLGDFNLAAKLYAMLCEYALFFGVTPLIETNGRLADSKKMLKFIDLSKAKNMGILWDVNHTVQLKGEAPADTVKMLGQLIKHVHIKDSIISDDNIEYKIMGYGNIPIPDILKALKDMGYSGYLSLEWVKRWNPDLQEPGIVFAHFASYMKTLLNKAGM
ncbi:MAG: sugar phosphate isomerase/epimerase [Oscillospiraceae bacterium]|nr:sugar phosphate isomerase/epimerase [Oscillospiraceae bacterium]